VQDGERQEAGREGVTRRDAAEIGVVDRKGQQRQADSEAAIGAAPPRPPTRSGRLLDDSREMCW
jgi:hypothetical protein